MLIEMKNSALVDKLMFIADGNIELVQDAIHFADRAKEIVRHGFLWLRKKEIVTDAADLASVVQFIVAKRDTHDGHALRRAQC